MEPLQQVAEITVSYKPAKGKKQVIASSKDAYAILRDFYSPDTISLHEQFLVMYLNKSNKVIGIYKASTGGITGTVADIRLILSVALKVAATGLVLSHNHPSGGLKPSREDEQLTSKIKQSAQLMDIKLLDHLIITEEECYSFADEGII
jgi:DNA repair protein RadC